MKKLWMRILAFLPLGDTTVLVDDGKAVCKRGKLSAAFLAELTGAAVSNGITSACVHATRTRGAGVKLRFFGIPPRLHQRFRNIWAANR